LYTNLAKIYLGRSRQVTAQIPTNRPNFIQLLISFSKSFLHSCVEELHTSSLIIQFGICKMLDAVLYVIIQKIATMMLQVKYPLIRICLLFKLQFQCVCNFTSFNLNPIATNLNIVALK
jgi:hypothetical protein